MVDCAEEEDAGFGRHCWGRGGGGLFGGDGLVWGEEVTHTRKTQLMAADREVWSTGLQRQRAR